VLAVSLAAASPLPTRLLRAYFIAELVGTLLLESVRYFTAFDTDLYRVLYCCALLPIRLLACTVTVKTSKWMSIVMIPYAAALMWVALNGIHGTVNVDQWILVVDGIMVASAGMVLAPVALHHEDRTVYGTLAILWMMLGLFDFGYVLQPFGMWRELNNSLLPVMVIGSFGWIAITTRADGKTRVSQRPVS